MSIGKRIKNARKKAGLTQRELGEILGVKQQTIAMFESDKTNIKFSTLCRFSKALGVPLNDLTGGDFSAFTQDEIEEEVNNHYGKPIFSKEDWQLDIIVGKALNLSDEARYKIIDYEDDLIMSGQYNRKQPT